MLELLFSLRIARFKFTIQALEEIWLPEYKGSTFRGGFGHAFKRATCITRDRFCEPCILKSSCAYYRVFESKVSRDVAERLRLGGDAPHPFVIEPPLTEQRVFQPGEFLSFSLVLFGTAVEQLPFFVYAFMILGENFGIGKGRGRFRLTGVQDENGTELYDNGSLAGGFAVRSAEELLSDSSAAVEDRVTLQLQTPLRLKTSFGRSRKSLLTTLDDQVGIRVLLKALYHRAFVLNQLYGDGVNEEVYDSRNLPLVDGDVTVEASDTFWYDWERYSNRQDRSMKLGGLMGRVTLSGNIKPFLPLLNLGRYLHVGKGTGFGLGKYQIVETNGAAP